MTGTRNPDPARDVPDLASDRARHEAEASFRFMMESSPDLVLVHRDRWVVHANPKALERLGYGDSPPLVGLPLTAIVAERDPRSVPPQGARGRPAPLEERWNRRDGTTVAVETQSGSVIFDGEPAEVLIAHDVTERNQIAAAMIELDRMAAIGILAAGVGHEINNPLAYVIANLEFVTSELDVIIGELPRPAFERLAPRITDLRQALADTNHGAERVRAIVQDLRTFSRSDDKTVMAVDVRHILDASLRIAAVQLRQSATIVKDYTDVPPVLANESRLGQVFLNLLVNAAQALPEGAPDDNRIELQVRLEEGFVTVTIADTGSGIPAEVLPRIFDPFFTTKPVGWGTGLGLGICRTTIEQLGGDIAVESTPGVGTRFIVRIPRARSGAERGLRESVMPRPGIVRRARILCVDDEPALGLALRRALVAEHDVVVLTNAADALERIKGGERFDVLLCDLMMPGMDGMELHAELLEVASDLAARLVFLTGGATTARAKHFLEAVPNARLEKPVTLDELRTAIGKMLSAS